VSNPYMGPTGDQYAGADPRELERLRRECDVMHARTSDAVAERNAAVTEVARLRHWIDTEGRNCPSESVVDEVLGIGEGTE
jgi:hypothetical protein